MAASTMCKECIYGNRSVLILKISQEIVFSVYIVIDMDTGEQNIVHKHQLSKCATIFVDDKDNDFTMDDMQQSENVKEERSERLEIFALIVNRQTLIGQHE